MDSQTQGTRLTKLEISGMSCGHCVHAVRAALAGVAGLSVRNVVVGSAEVEAADPASLAAAVAAIDEAGYSAKVVGATPSADRGGCGGGGCGCGKSAGA